MAEKNPELQKQRGGKGLAIKGAVTKTDTVPGEKPWVPPVPPQENPPKDEHRG